MASEYRQDYYLSDTDRLQDGITFQAFQGWRFVWW
jgi:hypothetical protein